MHPHLRVRVSSLALFLWLTGLSAPAAAEAPHQIALDASPQLFTLLYAARAAGVASAPSLANSPVEERVQQSLASLDPSVVEPLKKVFEANLAPENAGDLSPLVSLALVLGPPPDFNLTLPAANLPPDALSLRELPPVLKTFYAQAGVAQLWARVQPYYEQTLSDHQTEVAQTLLETRGYLRLIGEGYPGRSYTVYFSWLVPASLASARSYGEHYYLVINPQREGWLDAVRHQYLHFLLDPIALKYARDLSSWGRLQPTAARAPRLSESFREDMLLLATESLIQAVELRLQHLTPAAATAALDQHERAGYIFIRHFYQALATFEKAEPSIRYYFPDLLKGYDVDTEVARLRTVEFAPVEPAAPKAPASADAARTRLLLEADTLLAQHKYDDARERYERVLREQDPKCGEAFYGLALVASVEQSPERAKFYFLRTLENTQEPRILGWTNVYLGRIYDLEGNRDQALAYYRAALALHTQLDKIDRAARSGLQRAFGDKPEPEKKP